MKEHLTRMVTALFVLGALAISAKAQVSDQLIANIPYEFVVAGKTLPAGTYRVNRVADSNNRALVLSSFENGASALVISIEVENAPDDKPGFTFQEIGGQHFLSKIETAEHIFVFPVSKSTVLEAAMKSHQGSTTSVSAAGTN